MQLDQLSIVRLNNGWPDLGNLQDNVEVPAHYSGSPLARSWSYFDVTPLDWSWGPAGPHGRGLRPPEYIAFWTITVALSASEKRIRTFELGSGIDPATFDTQSIADEGFVSCGVDAFALLKELRLDIACGHDESHDPDGYDYLSGLQILLSRICYLENLEV